MRTVLITGVSRGIGKALAQKFLDNGDFVIGTSTGGTSDLSGRNLKIFRLDLSNAKSIEDCCKQISELGKKIDILINNAGTFSGKMDDVMRLGSLRETLEVNLIGTVDFTEHILPQLGNSSHIINISSGAGSLEYTRKANFPDYKISKAALNMYTKTLSIRLEGKTIVSSVHPGKVRTDMGGPQADLSPQEAAEYIFELANSTPQTGQFWFKNQKFPW